MRRANVVWYRSCVQPSLEHQDRPDAPVPVARAREVLAPVTCDGARIQVSLGGEGSGVEQILCPRPQRASQPLRQRHFEPALGSVDELAGDVAVEDLAQRALAEAVCAQ